MQHAPTPLRGAPEPRPPVRVGHPTVQRGAEVRNATGRDDHPRHATLRIAAERLRQPASVAHEDGDAPGQRLGNDHPVGLRARRHHEQVRARVGRVESRAGQRAGQFDATGQPVPLDRGADGVDVPGVAQRADQRGGPRQVADLGECCDQQVLALRRGERADEPVCRVRPLRRPVNPARVLSVLGAHDLPGAATTRAAEETE